MSRSIRSLRATTALWIAAALAFTVAAQLNGQNDGNHPPVF